MLKGFGGCIIILVLFALPVIAVESPDQVPATNQAGLTQQSKFLSAEAQRLIKDEITAAREELMAYQDENFIALDGQMKTTIGRAQKQLIIGSLGAFLLGGAIVAIIMFNIARKYSYEKFVEQQAAYEERKNEYYQDPNVQAMQQEDWGNLQEAMNPTLSQDYGQSFASNASQFSGWQKEAPYHGGWQWNGGNRK